MNIFKFYKKTFDGLSKDVWLVAWIYLINRSGEMVIPFMSLYVTGELAWSKTEAGIVLFCFGIGAMVGSSIGGYLCDRIGNFKVMAASLMGTAIAFPCIIFFTSFYPLCFWMFVSAICSSSFSPAAFGAVSHYSKPENVTRAYSLLRMAINLGVAIGPAIGGVLAYWVSYKWLFIGDGFTCFIAFFVLFKILGHRNKKPVQQKEDASEAAKSPYKDWILMLFLFLNLINMVAFFQILFSVPNYFREVVMMNEFWIGLFFTANGLLVFLFEMPLIYEIEKKNKFLKPMMLGAILIGIGFACLGFFTNAVIGIVCFSLLIAFGEIINFPLIPSLAMRRSNEFNKGKYMGAVSMMFASAHTLAPIAGLPVVERIGFENYWYLLAGLSVISGLSLIMLKKGFIEKKEEPIIV